MKEILAAFILFLCGLCSKNIDGEQRLVATSTWIFSVLSLLDVFLIDSLFSPYFLNKNRLD